MVGMLHEKVELSLTSQSVTVPKSSKGTHLIHVSNKGLEMKVCLSGLLCYPQIDAVSCFIG